MDLKRFQLHLMCTDNHKHKKGDMCGYSVYNVIYEYQSHNPKIVWLIHALCKEAMLFKRLAGFLPNLWLY